MSFSRIINLTRDFSKKCGYNTGLRFFIYRLIYGGSRRLEYRIRELFNIPSYKIEYIDGIPVIRSHIDLRQVGLKSTIPIYVSPYDYGLSRDIVIFKIREPIHVKILYNIINYYGLETVLDIGSNIGYFPLVELAAGSRSITAIEPVDDTFKYLKLNLRGCSDCELMNAAVGVQSDKIRMYIPLERNKLPILNLATVSRSAAAKYGANVKELEIDVISFSDILARQSYDLVRMDIEGYEWDLLSSSESIPGSIHAIDIEVHDGDPRKVRKALSNLKSNGFNDVIIVVNPSVPTFIVRLPGKIIGLEKSIELFNKLLVFNNNIKYCRRYEFKKPANRTTIDYLLDNLDMFLGYVGDAQAVFLRRF